MGHSEGGRAEESWLSVRHPRLQELVRIVIGQEEIRLEFWGPRSGRNAVEIDLLDSCIFSGGHDAHGLINLGGAREAGGHHHPGQCLVAKESCTSLCIRARGAPKTVNSDDEAGRHRGLQHLPTAPVLGAKDAVRSKSAFRDAIGAEEKAQAGVATDSEVTDFGETADGLGHVMSLIGGKLDALEIGVTAVILLRPSIDAPKGGDGPLRQLDGRRGEGVLVYLQRQRESKDVGAKGPENAHAAGEGIVGARVDLGRERDDDIAEVAGRDLGFKLSANKAQGLDVGAREVRDNDVEYLYWNVSHGPVEAVNCEIGYCEQRLANGSMTF